MPSANTLPAESISFDDPQLAATLFGPLNVNLQAIAEATGARLDSRGATLSVSHTTPRVREAIALLFAQSYALLRDSFPLTRDDLLHGLDLLLADPTADLGKVFRQAGVLITGRKQVQARNASQREYLRLMRDNEMVFGIGPAGTGKTYLAVAKALSLLAEKRVRKIILTRPAVEAGEKLGFLPGDMEEKVNPYLRPLYDAMGDILGPAGLAAKQEAGLIEVAPLAFMRGRTINHAFLILDEAQNTTQEQMKMFLTRLGEGSRAVITGDVTQIDLPRHSGPWLRQGEREGDTRSGLLQAIQVLRGVRGIGFHHFDAGDVVRHPLVGRIVRAYEQFESAQSAVEQRPTAPAGKKDGNSEGSGASGAAGNTSG